MKNKKTWLLVAMLLPAFVLQAQTFTQKGNIELGGDITFSSISANDGDESLSNFSLNPYIGIFLTNNFELGFRPGFESVSSGGESITSLNLLLAPAYNFSTGSMVYPYLEFLIGYNSISAYDESMGGLCIGMDGGMKINVAGNSLLLIKLEYLHQTYTEEYAGEEFDNSLSTLSFGLGFRVFFGPKTAAK